MVDCIQIGPGVLMAALVLSPEWGLQYRQQDTSAQRTRSPQAASHAAEGSNQQQCDVGERSSEQMTLL
jgi:hypothetical protein